MKLLFSYQLFFTPTSLFPLHPVCVLYLPCKTPTLMQSDNWLSLISVNCCEKKLLKWFDKPLHNQDPQLQLLPQPCTLMLFLVLVNCPSHSPQQISNFTSKILLWLFHSQSMTFIPISKKYCCHQTSFPSNTCPLFEHCFIRLFI